MVLSVSLSFSLCVSMYVTPLLNSTVCKEPSPYLQRDVNVKRFLTPESRDGAEIGGVKVNQPFLSHETKHFSPCRPGPHSPYRSILYKKEDTVS